MVTAAAAQPSVVNMREATRARARRVLALAEQGWSPVAIADHEGITDSYVRMLLATARAEAQAGERAASPEAHVVAAQGKRISEQTLLNRAWITLHLDRRLWAMDNGKRMFWLEAVVTLHRLGAADGLQFGRYGDGFESRAEFAAAHGGTEADLEALFRRGLLTALENGGIAIPPGVGLRPWGKGHAVSAAPPLPPRPAAVHRSEKGPVPGQRAFVMGMPSADPDGSAANFAAAAQGEDANLCASPGGLGANICVGDGGPAANPCEIGEKDFLARVASASALEKDALEGRSRSNSNTGLRATDANLRTDENLRPDTNLRNLRDLPADVFGPEQAWVSLARELADVAGYSRPITPAEAQMVRAWCDAGADPDLLRGTFRVKLEQKSCPDAPPLSYFEGAVADALKAARKTAAIMGAPPSDAGPSPAASPAAVPDDEDLAEPETGPGLSAQWARIRRRLRDEVGSVEYRTWLRQMRLAGVEGDEIVVTLPTRFLRDWVKNHFGDRLNMLWRDEAAEIERVRLDVSAEAADAVTAGAAPMFAASG